MEKESAALKRNVVGTNKTSRWAFSLCFENSQLTAYIVFLIQVLKLLHGDDDATEWARSEVSSSADPLDDEMLNLEPDIRSHLNLALLDLEDDSNSVSSTDHTVDSLTVSTSVENYLQWRWSHSSSFD